MTVDARRILRNAAAFLWPFVLLAIVLGLNIALHHDDYVPPVQDAYIAPVITAEPLTTTNTGFVPSSEVAKPEPAPWDPLADCESGDHDTLPGGRWVIHPGTARWHIANTVHQGGLQFAASTWDAYRPAGFPVDAHLATKAQQIAVAVRVRDGVPGTRDPYLNPQGWGAWPRCSRIVGLRP